MTNFLILALELPERDFELDDKELFDDTERAGEINLASMVHSFAKNGHLN